ncbi:elicitor-responsive protein 3-like [Rutidosis leptorrhynchoides]|uniref:elicitor-responsive protein 3-like n=1 Tax=Rutidosis leptorrhynchoides TaxID=125765 RepID=UPI003A9901D8
MKGGILEVFLEGAKDIRHTNLIVHCLYVYVKGKPKYYVIVECGYQHYKSKSSKGEHHKVSWNEKLTFELSMSECQKLTHLRLRIMDRELFDNDTGFVGEARVFLEDILMEGNEKGLIELTPKPYNVVLDDETYKGEIKVGLKFIPNTDIRETGRGLVTRKVHYEDSLWKKLVNFCKMSWWRLSFYGRKLNNPNEYKRI